MPMTHSGAYPIEHYYPGGFGGAGSDCSFTWVPIVQTIPNDIFEYETVGENKCIQMAIRADYTQCLEDIIDETYVTPSGTSSISPSCCMGGVGALKYAVLGGEFPPSLYLNIDTGEMVGVIDSIEVSAAKRLGVPPNFKFDETNYAKYAVSGLSLICQFRVFDSGNTSSYNDIEALIPISTNWSARRDKFGLNIENQFYLDGKPVTNKTYIKGVKSKGYYPGPGCS